MKKKANNLILSLLEDIKNLFSLLKMEPPTLENGLEISQMGMELKPMQMVTDTKENSETD